MTEEQEHQNDLVTIKNFRLIDDSFMQACFDDNVESIQLMLRVILEKPDLIVKHLSTQRHLKNLMGHDVRFDVLASDKEKKKYNIEIQRNDYEADVRRARYHSSMLDARQLKKGAKYKHLRETYVIFITEFDYLKGGKPIYHIDRKVDETGKRFNDGSHIIYVNGENRDSNTALGLLIKDLFCTEPDDMHYNELARRLGYFKKTEEGVRVMCKALEEMRARAEDKGRKEGRKEGRSETKQEIVQGLIKNGKLTHKEISESVNIPIKEVKKISKMMA